MRKYLSKHYEFVGWSLGALVVGYVLLVAIAGLVSSQ